MLFVQIKKLFSSAKDEKSLRGTTFICDALEERHTLRYNGTCRLLLLHFREKAPGRHSGSMQERPLSQAAFSLCMLGILTLPYLCFLIYAYWYASILSRALPASQCKLILFFYHRKSFFSGFHGVFNVLFCMRRGKKHSFELGRGQGNPLRHHFSKVCRKHFKV